MKLHWCHQPNFDVWQPICMYIARMAFQEHHVCPGGFSLPWPHQTAGIKQLPSGHSDCCRSIHGSRIVNPVPAAQAAHPLSSPHPSLPAFSPLPTIPPFLQPITHPPPYPCHIASDSILLTLPLVCNQPRSPMPLKVVRNLQFELSGQQGWSCEYKYA